MIVEHTSQQTVNVSLLGITDKDRTTLVLGDDLWNVNSYFSKQPDGIGKRFDEKRRILDDIKEGKDLPRDEDLLLDFIDVDINLQGRTCNQVPYMCFELEKNKIASIKYEFEESITRCIDISDRCTGKLI